METSIIQSDFYHIGQIAYRTGDPSAPILNSAVQAAIANESVGGNAARIMREFSRCWHDANLKAQS